ncbi:hypothetical protein ACFL05_00595 [Patescibacteria group bacterium]
MTNSGCGKSLIRGKTEIRRKLMSNEKTYDRQTASFLAAVATCMPRDLSGDVMQCWIENPTALQKVLAEALCPPKNYITHTFTILVDETKTVEELVKEGKFDWSNDDIISKNFPQPEGGAKSEKEIALFHFNKTMTSDDVIAEMDKDGYRPATIWELLGLGIIQPDLQREFPIIALGSVCVLLGGRRVAGLYRHAGERPLDLGWFVDSWSDFCRFAGVRK